MNCGTELTGKYMKKKRCAVNIFSRIIFNFNVTNWSTWVWNEPKELQNNCDHWASTIDLLLSKQIEQTKKANKQTKHICIIVRALYGTKSGGASFRNHLADCMHHLGYDPCKADPDVRLKRFTKPNGRTYFSYILLYVDDVMCINHGAKARLHKLNHHFKMKPGSIGDPADLYI